MLQTGRLAAGGLAALVLAASVTFTQGADRQDRSLIDARPLTDSEIATVLSLSQKALGSKTFRLTALSVDQAPTEVVMGSGGQPRMMRSTGSIIGGVVSANGSAGRPSETRWRREFVRIIHYTGQPVYRCGETSGRGELVMEFVARINATL